MPRRRVLVVGSPRDGTFRHSIAAFERQRLDFAVLDTDRFCKHGRIEGLLGAPQSLVLFDGAQRFRIAEFDSCYARFVDLPADWTGAAAKRWASHRLLQRAIAAMDGRVVNRPGSGGSNDSKPYQTALLERYGFDVPRGCSTNLASAAARFIASCPSGTIYKSNSGQRSVVQAIGPGDVDRLASLTRCPVYFQERIWGADIRVHVVGDVCHAVLIRSDEVDYRYDVSGAIAECAVELPPELADRCRAVTAAFGLEFAGIDFVRSDDDGRYYCLEVNPMPGYHGYDVTLDHAISDSLGQLLTGQPAPRKGRPSGDCGRGGA